jgi:2,4-dienoyl-CoA reductase-like NADH-dependent reductase (Old Yellow Enzyme family)
VGPDFIVIYHLSMLDLIPDGSTWAEAVTLAKAVVKAGATILNTGIGWHDARVPTIATSVPRGACAVWGQTTHATPAGKRPAVNDNLWPGPAIRGRASKVTFAAAGQRGGKVSCRRGPRTGAAGQMRV